MPEKTAVAQFAADYAPFITAAGGLVTAVVSLGLGFLIGQIVQANKDVRARQRPKIQCLIAADPVMSSSLRSMQVVLRVTSDEKATEYGGLLLATVIVRNASDVDFPEFPFTIAPAAGTSIISLEGEAPDASHRVAFGESNVEPFSALLGGTVASPSAPLVRPFLVRLAPLNTTDSYVVRMLIHSPELEGRADDGAVPSMRLRPIVSTAVPVELQDARDVEQVVAADDLLRSYVGVVNAMANLVARILIRRF